MASREFDVILYGATGFTGRQTVRYFQRHAPPGLRWAIAGRSRARLEALEAGVPILVADGASRGETGALAARTRVLLSTAGPFVLYGDLLVEACVEAATHYTDITGELAWVRTLIDRFHARAARDGTRIVPFCGFDSVPADLGVSLLIEQLGPGITEAKGYFQAGGGGGLNGGTMASAHQTYSSGAAEVQRDPFLLNPGKYRPLLPCEADPERAAYDPDVRAWTAPFPMSLIDTRVVRRSAGLLGLDIACQEYLIFEGPLAPLYAAGASAGVALFFKALRSPRVRDLLAAHVLKPGEGPSDKAMDKGWFRCRIRGRTADGRAAEAVLSGKGDPSNRVTVQCVCQSALALACDEADLPPRAGVLTPATGLGSALVRRLQASGMSIACRALQMRGAGPTRGLINPQARVKPRMRPAPKRVSDSSTEPQNYL